MAEDGSDPFKLGALDPMLADETGSECGGADEYSTVPVTGLWPSTSNPCGVQEYVPDSAIDPSLLRYDSQALHSLVTQAEVSTSAETDLYSLNKT